MARYETTVTTPMSPTEAFRYMADMRNFVEWDPGVESVEQVKGDGPGPDAVFDVAIAGRRPMMLQYRTVEYDEPNELLLVAESKALRSVDRIIVRADDQGSRVTYDAELTLNGLFKIAEPVMKLMFRRIGDRADAGLRRVLTQPTVH